MDPKKTGEFLSICRKGRHLTQARFAELLGVTDKAVSKWETGKCLPDVSLFDDICGILGITLNELFAGECTPPECREEQPPKHMAEESRTNRKLRIPGKMAALLLVLFSVSIHVSVGGLALNGSPVFFNLFFTLLTIPAWGVFLKLTQREVAVQKILYGLSLVLLASCVLSFALTFWDADEWIINITRFPAGLLFYGFRLLVGWSPLYAAAGGLSLISLLYVGKNLKK